MFECDAGCCRTSENVATERRATQCCAQAECAAAQLAWRPQNWGPLYVKDPQVNTSNEYPMFMYKDSHIWLARAG